MSHLLSVNPKVRIYAPKEGFGVYGADLPSAFYRKDESLPAEQRYYDGKPPDVMRFGSAWPQANIVLVDKATMIAPGIHLISLVSDRPGTLELRELSLAIETPDGMVIVVGCSHTGIDNIVKAATAIQPKIQLRRRRLPSCRRQGPGHRGHHRDAARHLQGRLRRPRALHRRTDIHGAAKAFGERCLYAGLGSTIALGVAPRAVGDSGPAVPSALSDDDLKSYQTLSRQAANAAVEYSPTCNERLRQAALISDNGDAAWWAVVEACRRRHRARRRGHSHSCHSPTSAPGRDYPFADLADSCHWATLRSCRRTAA